MKEEYAQPGQLMGGVKRCLLITNIAHICPVAKTFINTGGSHLFVGLHS